MNELKMIRVLLDEAPPSAEVIAEGRRRVAASAAAPGFAGARRGAARGTAAGLLRPRRRAVRVVVACGAAAAVAIGVAVTVGTGGAAGPAKPAGGSAAYARLAAYVTKRVENALAGQNLVFVGRSDSPAWGNTVTWAYGSRNSFEEYWPATDQRDRIVNGKRLWDFPPQLRGQPYLAQGTALVGGKLVYAYVTYFDHRYSLAPLTAQPSSACSTNEALSMGGPVIPTTRWTAFIDATLACGAASVTGHVMINGVETTKITGKPVTVRLSPGYAKTVHEQWVTGRWTLYVNSATYLPVRMYGSTESYGGSAGRYTSSSVTDVQWLKPTAANIAQALVTIPPGFHRFYGNPGNQ
jgi:hypothetical protein